LSTLVFTLALTNSKLMLPWVQFAIDFLLASFVEQDYLDTDMCKFELSQKGESRA